MKDYVQEHRSAVKVVKANWLRQCGKERSLLAASHDYLVPLSSLTAPPARLVPVSPDKQEAQKVSAGPIGGGQEVDSGGPQAGQKASGGGLEGDECEAAVGSQAPKHQALKGLWCHLSACFDWSYFACCQCVKAEPESQLCVSEHTTCLVA